MVCGITTTWLCKLNTTPGLFPAAPNNVSSSLCRKRHGIEWVETPLGRVLHESGSKMGYAYSPATAIVSLMFETEDGSSIELAVVANR